MSILDATWHKAAIIFLLGGPAFVGLAAIAGTRPMFATVALWALTGVATWIAEGRALRRGEGPR